MNQILVKWVATCFLYDENPGKAIPVIPLSALREVVEGVQVLRTYTNMQEDERNERLDALLALLGEGQ